MSRASLRPPNGDRGLDSREGATDFGHQVCPEQQHCIWPTSASITEYHDRRPRTHMNATPGRSPRTSQGEVTR